MCCTEKINIYLGLCRLCEATFVPSFLVYPFTFTVIGPLRGGFSEQLPLVAIISPSFKCSTIRVYHEEMCNENQNFRNRIRIDKKECL